MPDVDRLLDGHGTVGGTGHWHRVLSSVDRDVTGLSTSPRPRLKIRHSGSARSRNGRSLSPARSRRGLPGPQEVIPSATLSEREEAEGLRQAIAHYQASPGPVIAHRRFGPLTRDEWDRIQLIHVAHHLSFAVPRRERVSGFLKRRGVEL